MSEMKASIFNIQKFSVNDGPGIRTVVFFKGCPLRCTWCANPESQMVKPQVMWDEKKCTRCKTCIRTCPSGVITLQDNHIHIDHNHCQSCQKCILACPNDALEKVGKTMCVEDVMKVVRQDIDFYEESDGGITLSGGEFLAQSSFAISLLKQCKEEHIDTCCETTGYGSPDIFQQVIPYLDHMYMDLKHYDNTKHIQGTGVSLERILTNIDTALSSAKDLTIRIPVIPSYNDALEDAHGFVQLCTQHHITKVQLLPFHQFGENKYHLLDYDYAFENVPSLHPEDLEEYCDIFLQHGIHAYF